MEDKLQGAVVSALTNLSTEVRGKGTFLGCPISEPRSAIDVSRWTLFWLVVLWRTAELIPLTTTV